MVDAKAVTFFCGQQEASCNQFCVDSGAANPEWASVSHGIYVSIGASGIHRSLGVRVSFVQSMTMDSWKPVHLKMMELGGNQRFQDFMDQHGVPRDLPIREKYQTRAAAWYREELRALAEGREPQSPLPPNTGHLSTCEAASETQRMLDQVFAQAPQAAQMTAGGVPTAKPRRRLASSSPCGSPRKRCVLADIMHKQLRNTLKSCKRTFLTSTTSTSTTAKDEPSFHLEGTPEHQCRSRSRSPAQCAEEVPSENLPSLAVEN